MKKVLCKKNLKYILPLLAVLAVMVILVFVLSGNDDRREVQKHKYFLTLDFDAESKTLSGREEVFYINSSENMFETLYFHLYLIYIYLSFY